MRRLYLRIYLAVLASLVVFAFAAGVLWRQFSDASPARHGFDLAGTLAQNVLPPVEAPGTAQQSALEKLAANLKTDVTLYSADRRALASVGEPVSAPREGRTHGGWTRGGDGPPGWAVALPDGRWLVARVPRDRPHPGWRLFLTLALLALAVGVGAYPVVRRLTRRLEKLQQGVESLGAGQLGARVDVQGRDEVAQLAQSFNDAAARIEALVAAHKTLLAHASHELRTPLARIRMSIELMRGSADPQRRADLEHDIAELDALIDEILLASRLDAVDARPAPETVDLLALAAEECARYPEADLDGQPASVQGEARLLRRMIRNLLENARRHGAPPVALRVSRSGAGTVEIAVCDAGPGVPEAERDRVFEPFYRFAGARESSGTGLGLALVRSIAERHGGSVRYRAPVEGGGCFSVTLPGGTTGAG